MRLCIHSIFSSTYIVLIDREMIVVSRILSFKPMKRLVRRSFVLLCTCNKGIDSYDEKR